MGGDEEAGDEEAGVGAPRRINPRSDRGGGGGHGFPADGDCGS